MTIDMIPVDSQCLARVGRDGADLILVMRTGKRYRYLEVPTDVWLGLLSCPGKGAYYNKYIKNVYECVLEGTEEVFDD